MASGLEVLTNGHGESSSESSDEETYALPSVKQLASEFNTLTKQSKQTTVPVYNRNVYSQAANIASKSVVESKKKPVVIHKVSVKTIKENTAPAINRKREQSSSLSSDDDDVFVQNSSKPLSSKKDDKVLNKEPEVDSSSKNVFFGVTLRKVDNCIWGIKQKKMSTTSDDQKLSPVSPFSSLQTDNRFATFPKRKQVEQLVEDPITSYSLDRKAGGGTGGVKGKIASQKLGDKMKVQYHSHSDLSEIDPPSSTWRRKSLSDDYIELNQQRHPPLTRRQSINDLLNLYRTKSQTDLSQFCPGPTPTPSFKPNKFTVVDEKQTKPSISTPLTMNDVKICTPMTNVKASPYKPPVKDIVRIREPVIFHKKVANNHSQPFPLIEKKPQEVARYSTSSSSSDSEEDVKTYASDKKNRQNASEKSFDDRNSQRLTAMLTPAPYVKHKQEVIKEVRPKVVEEQIERCISEPKFKPPPLRKTNSISSLINALNENKGLRKSVSSSDSESSSNDDSVDRIPHDEKLSSYIVPEPAVAKVTANFNRYKTAEHSKPKTKIPVVRHFSLVKSPVEKSVSVDEVDIAHDDKVPSFVVTKLPPKAVVYKIPQPVKSTSPVKKAMSVDEVDIAHDDKVPSFVVTKLPPKAEVNKITQSVKPASPKITTSTVTSHVDSNNSCYKSEDDWVKVNNVGDDSSSSGSEGRRGSYDVTGHSVKFDLKPKILREVHKSRFAGSTSDSSQDELKRPKKSSLRALNEPIVTSVKRKSLETPDTSKMTVIEKPTPSTRITRLELSGTMDDQYVNIRPNTVDGNSRAEQNKDKPKSKIPLFTKFKNSRSSSSDDDQSAPKLRSFKEHHTNYTLTSNNKLSAPDVNKQTSLILKQDEETSGSSGEQFKDFDPYAIGRMIVRGARKRDSTVKKPEHLTNINNATIPVNSPFSPRNAASSKRESSSRLKADLRQVSSTSSSSDDDKLSYLDAQEHAQDGVYSASVAFMN